MMSGSFDQHNMKRRSFAKRLSALLVVASVPFQFTGCTTLFSSSNSSSTQLLTATPVGVHPHYGKGATVYTHGWQDDLVFIIGWSPDSKRIVSAGGYRGEVYIWDATTGKHASTYMGHVSLTIKVDSGTRYNQPSSVRALSWSPDGRWIASGGEDRAIQIWNPDNGVLFYTYNGHNNSMHGPLAVAWSPNGKYVASLDDRTVHVWDPTNGTLVYLYQGQFMEVQGLTALCWSPDGKYIATAANEVKVWDALSGQELLTYKKHMRSPSAPGVATVSGVG